MAAAVRYSNVDYGYISSQSDLEAFHSGGELDEGCGLVQITKLRPYICCTMLGGVCTLLACAPIIALRSTLHESTKQQHGLLRRSSDVLHTRWTSTSTQDYDDSQSDRKDVSQKIRTTDVAPIDFANIAKNNSLGGSPRGSQNVSTDIASSAEAQQTPRELANTTPKHSKFTSTTTNAVTYSTTGLNRWEYFPNFDYTGSRHDVAYCFCQIAGNCPVNQSTPCACRQARGNPYACTGIVFAENVQTTTFANIKKATGCGRKRETALLTIPKSYVANITDMRKVIASAQEDLLKAMLAEGFNYYQKNIAVIPDEPVNQCIHHSDKVSVKWLHLHTFCSAGKVDGQPNDKYSYCFTMANLSDATWIAKAMLVASRAFTASVARKGIARHNDMQEWISDYNGTLESFPS